MPLELRNEDSSLSVGFTERRASCIILGCEVDTNDFHRAYPRNALVTFSIAVAMSSMSSRGPRKTWCGSQTLSW